MSPSDLRRKLETALHTIPGLTISGAGSMLIPPYDADISVDLNRHHFIITIKLTGAESAAA